MTNDELLEQFPGFTLEQIKAGLATPAVEMSVWDRRLHEHEHSIYGDALAIGATEHVADQIEPLWKSIVGLVCVVIIIAGIGAVLFGFFS